MKLWVIRKDWTTISKKNNNNNEWTWKDKQRFLTGRKKKVYITENVLLQMEEIFDFLERRNKVKKKKPNKRVERYGNHIINNARKWLKYIVWQ